MKGARYHFQEDRTGAIRDLLARFVAEGLVDAVLLPHRTPSEKSYAYILAKAQELLGTAEPLPPIMPLHGARALAGLGLGEENQLRIAAFMRPCEIRGVIELHKLHQIDLKSVILVSIDCPGAVTLSSWLSDPQAARASFDRAIDEPDQADLRPLCRICDRFSLTGSDLHLGTLGVEQGELLLVPASDSGAKLLADLDIETECELEDWEQAVAHQQTRREEKRREAMRSYHEEFAGIEGLTSALASCLGCRICRAVCPICICRECYFESAPVKTTAEDYLLRAERTGTTRFPPDTTLFHLGRMAHMSAQCLSCGVCEDACPAGVPVSRMFALAGSATGALFDYVPGMDPDQELPLVAYREDELEDVTS